MLGEPQILGQLKDAYRAAQETGSTGPVLNRLFQTAFSVAKRVRTETRDRRQRGVGRLRGGGDGAHRLRESRATAPRC